MRDGVNSKNPSPRSDLTFLLCELPLYYFFVNTCSPLMSCFSCFTHKILSPPPSGVGEHFVYWCAFPLPPLFILSVAVFRTFVIFLLFSVSLVFLFLFVCLLHFPPPQILSPGFSSQNATPLFPPEYADGLPPPPPSWLFNDTYSYLFQPLPWLFGTIFFPFSPDTLLLPNELP